MRKALTLSAIALASSMALAAPAVAFAADSVPTAHSSASADAKTAPVALKLSPSSGKPGDSVQMSMEVPDGSTNLSISSKALNDVKMTDGRGATATIAKVADGNYGISLTGTGPKGEKLQATAEITVKDGKPTPKPTPTPADSTLSLSQDHGKPGDKIQVTIKTAANEKSAFVKSDAFGGQVNLKSNGKGVWTGTAVVAKDVKSGYYGVEAYAGGKKFDTVKFSTDATGPVNPKPKPTPVDPSHHKTPKGSVNTGQAPLGWVPSDAANHG
ncbi:hypothetical protein OHA37_21310 [Streptomyces sp. NBC_00335]|uniref:hypothetical protein n=1 Tax=unclassified Streptomyces TaxID=2593676 RepID=UPI0022541376|nr:MULTISPECIES: hypothetical protein [unclassified Streptomyces]MCX5406401.1 hypothetical protein [Streptomyces sp. NBC_00086]